MACTPEFVQYVAEQLALCGEITYRKLFGEYGFYCNGKFFATAEDNQFYLKITDAGQQLMPDAVIASPHEGARAFLIENLCDRDQLARLVQATCAALPEPKPKKPKKPKQTKGSAPHA